MFEDLEPLNQIIIEKLKNLESIAEENEQIRDQLKKDAESTINEAKLFNNEVKDLKKKFDKAHTELKDLIKNAELFKERASQLVDLSEETVNKISFLSVDFNVVENDIDKYLEVILEHSDYYQSC